jgi:hypothetical protein
MKASDLVVLPLPNGLHVVLWMLEVTHVRMVRRKTPQPYCSFVVMAGFHAAVPAGKQLPELATAEHPYPFMMIPGQSNIWKGCFFGVVPADFTVLAERELQWKNDPYSRTKAR